MENGKRRDKLRMMMMEWKKMDGGGGRTGKLELGWTDWQKRAGRDRGIFERTFSHAWHLLFFPSLPFPSATIPSPSFPPKHFFFPSPYLPPVPSPNSSLPFSSLPSLLLFILLPISALPCTCILSPASLIPVSLPATEDYRYRLLFWLLSGQT